MSTASTLRQMLSGAVGRPARGDAAHIDAPPRVVARLELPRFAGTWYEIASTPRKKHAPYEATTKTYTLRPNGRIGVLWRSLDPKRQRVRTTHETATTPNPWEPGKLKARRRFIFSTDYWVLEIDPDYEWAFVGTPDRRNAWLLSRLPLLDESVVARLCARLRHDGFPVERLTRTRQIGV